MTLGKDRGSKHLYKFVNGSIACVWFEDSQAVSKAKSDGWFGTFEDAASDILDKINTRLGAVELEVENMKLKIKPN